jgi:hypothetical protein
MAVLTFADTDSKITGTAVVGGGRYSIQIKNDGAAVFTLSGGTFATEKDAEVAAARAFWRFLGWFWSSECPSPAGCRNRYPYSRVETVRVSDGLFRLITSDATYILN